MAILKLHRHGAPPFTIDRDRVLVGRDPGSDVVVDDKSVSRRHAVLERRGPGFALVDQGSANGSFVNGEQVKEAALYDGQELRLGMVPFRVEIESEVEGTVIMDLRAGGVPATVMMPSSGTAPAPAGARRARTRPRAGRALGPPPGRRPPPPPGRRPPPPPRRPTHSPRLRP